MTARVLFHTQHLLGIGHLMRALRITEALLDAGFAVELALGGVPVAGLGVAGARLLQLPPLSAGPKGFAQLMTPDGTAPDAAYMDRRREALGDALLARPPDIVLIEAFPFGRRMLRTEMLALLHTARQVPRRPLVASSIRDILQRSPRPERRAETVALVEQEFDAVLVHGDPGFARLDETFPEVTRFAEKVHYTGFVAPGPAHAATAEPADVIVTAGGGAVGFALLSAALQARPYTCLAGARWLVVTGPQMPAAERQVLTTLGAEAGCRVVPFVMGLPALFAQAAVVVTQAGYNTATELLATCSRAVLVPFAEGGETEQTERATRLAARGHVVTMPAAELSPARLAAAIDAAQALPPRTDPGVALNGATRTAEILADLLHARAMIA